MGQRGPDCGRLPGQRSDRAHRGLPQPELDRVGGGGNEIDAAARGVDILPRTMSRSRSLPAGDRDLERRPLGCHIEKADDGRALAVESESEGGKKKTSANPTMPLVLAQATGKLLDRTS